MSTTLEQLRTQYPHLSDDAIADLAAVTMKLGNNQKTRKGFLGLMKEADPSLPIPEIDEVKAVHAEFAKRDEEIAALKRERQEEKFSATLAKQKDEAKREYGLSDEDMKKMEEMMTKGELPVDYRFAPKLYKMQIEATTPTNYGTGGYGPLDINGAMKENGMEGLMDDPDNWSLKTAHGMIEEMQRKGRANAF